MYPRTAPPAAASAVSTTRCTRLNARNEFFAAHAVSRGQRCAMSAVFSGRPLLKSSASDAPCDSATSRHETASGSRVVACRASSCSSVPPRRSVARAPCKRERRSAAAASPATRDAPRLSRVRRRRTRRPATSAAASRTRAAKRPRSRAAAAAADRRGRSDARRDLIKLRPPARSRHRDRRSPQPPRSWRDQTSARQSLRASALARVFTPWLRVHTGFDGGKKHLEGQPQQLPGGPRLRPQPSRPSRESNMDVEALQRARGLLTRQLDRARGRHRHLAAYDTDKAFTARRLVHAG